MTINIKREVRVYLHFGGVNPAVHNFKFMAEVSPANAWMLGAAVVVAATAFVAVSGSAKTTTFVPV